MKPQELILVNNQHDVAEEGEEETKRRGSVHKLQVLSGKTVCSEEIYNVEERDSSCEQQNKKEENQQEEGRQEEGQKSTSTNFKQNVVNFLQSIAFLSKSQGEKDEPNVSRNHHNNVCIPMVHHQSLSTPPCPPITSTAGTSTSRTPGCPLPFTTISSFYPFSSSSDTIVISNKGGTLNRRASNVLHDASLTSEYEDYNEATKAEKRPSSTATTTLLGNDNINPPVANISSCSSQQGPSLAVENCLSGDVKNKDTREQYVTSVLSSDESSKMITRTRGSILTNHTSSVSSTGTSGTSAKKTSVSSCPAVSIDEPQCTSSTCTSTSTPTSILKISSSSSPLSASQRKIAARQTDQTTTPLSRIPTSKYQQLLDDIDCGTGLVFLDFDNGDNKFSNRYLSTPGVRVFEDHKSNNKNAKNTTKGGQAEEKKLKDKKTRKSTGNTKRSCSSPRRSTKGQEEHHNQNTTTLYKARGKFFDVSVNLGCHRSSAAAAAAVDIANVLFWGGENIKKPLYVLSLNEIEKGLKAAGVNDVKALSDVFRQKFNEEHKVLFENYVENTLCSIGGKDDDAANVLCCLNKYYDGKKYKRQVKNMEGKEHNEEERRSKKRKKRGANQLLFDGEHVIYEIDNDGIFSWRRSSESI
mmetsp:Transcript_9282/g.13793  ORF Transcript_9282/g.13793 Transcript_9282/m.13793 type:complete len:639 (-) Transcript_9282:85-2001(-)|eukprot:CAMPEP_0203677086 /NCGR_PEP_ID=MMETSP0090-20130426/27013_1 /ASSEMBLY_ACC=CAM_ASM_001088 /TAXON_ID=426623 /ORGANISM="Chaetoceros affinis, Strain CCMP159" /LENGTH=638 /DNA_ID=CAMNT_0050543875 /DNA_START=467 /DNA_END=2383 /DNA_ORIENTATION=+